MYLHLSLLSLLNASLSLLEIKFCKYFSVHILFIFVVVGGGGGL